MIDKHQIALEYAQYFTNHAIEAAKSKGLGRFEALLKENPNTIPDFLEGWKQKGLQAIEGIETKSEEWLRHCGNGLFSPLNPASGKLLCAVLGVPRPTTRKGFEAILEAYAGPEIRAYKEARRLEQEAKEAERLKLEQEAEARVIEVLKNKLAIPGGQISGLELVGVARSIGIAVHPRTAGSCKRVHAIGECGARLSGKSIPDGVWSLLREVLRALAPVTV